MGSELEALDEFQARLEAVGGAIDAAAVPAGLRALRAYLEAGAPQGRALRGLTARLRPQDAEAVALTYLFVVVVDAAVHEGREGVLAQYAASGRPLAEAAGEFHAILISEAFLVAAGRRPRVGRHGGCQA